jgi:hypothetical protein
MEQAGQAGTDIHSYVGERIHTESLYIPTGCVRRASRKCGRALAQTLGRRRYSGEGGGSNSPNATTSTPLFSPIVAALRLRLRDLRLARTSFRGMNSSAQPRGCPRRLRATRQDMLRSSARQPSRRFTTGSWYRGANKTYCLEDRRHGSCPIPADSIVPLVWTNWFAHTANFALRSTELPSDSRLVLRLRQRAAPGRKR